MAFDFPNAPTIGQSYQGYVWDGEKWQSQTTSAVGAVRYDIAQGLTANQQAQARQNTGITKKNYLLNGAMQVSQENGVTAGTTSGYYAADQFRMDFSNAGTQTAQQVASLTPGGSPNRLRVTATVADASVAAGDYCNVFQIIEGLRVADLRSGSAAARTVTIQFGVKAPAGTYCVTVRNGGVNRTYIAEYVIAAGEANTDVVKSVTLQLDQTGTWAADNTTGLWITWALMAGSTFQGAVNSWQAGNFHATANQFNFMGTASNVFELFDVGLYEGNVAPPFTVPDYPGELALCQRYFYKRVYATSTYIGMLQAYSTTAASGILFDFPVTMRVAPTVVATGSFQLISAAGGALPLTNIAYLVTPDTVAVSPINVASGLVGGNASMYGCSGAAFHTANARL